MPQDVFVTAYERVGLGRAVGPAESFPAQSALVLDPDFFTLTDLPNALVSGPRGESIQGATLASMTGLGLRGPVVSTTDGSTVLLFSSIVVPSGKGVVLNANALGRIKSAASWADYYWTVSVSYGNPAGALQWNWGGTSPTTGPSQLPWAQGLAGSQVVNFVAITGAADNGSGLVRVTLGAGNIFPIAGDTVLITGAVTTGGLVINGSWIVASVLGSGPGATVDLAHSTWTGAWSSGGTLVTQGGVTVTVSGPSLLISATGIQAAQWHQSDAVHAGDVRYTPNGVYLYTHAGTTSGSGTGPSGTGTGIADGSATVDYLCPGTGVPITWQAVGIQPYIL